MKKTNKPIVTTANQWKIRAKNDRKNREDITRAQAFALELLDYMDATNITQVELAKKMCVSPQHVNKILRAKSNLTFETMDKIARALGVKISSPKIEPKPKVLSSKIVDAVITITRSTVRFTYETKIHSKNYNAKNPILLTSLENINPYKHTYCQI